MKTILLLVVLAISVVFSASKKVSGKICMDEDGNRVPCPTAKLQTTPSSPTTHSPLTREKLCTDEDGDLIPCRRLTTRRPTPRRSTTHRPNPRRSTTRRPTRRPTTRRPTPRRSTTHRPTTRRPTRRPTTHSPSKSQCELALEIAGIQYVGVGGYVPQCEANGDYTRVQFWPSAQLYWCVDKKTGKIIGKITSEPPNCDIQADHGTCARETNFYPRSMTFHPHCDEDGDYLHYQYDPHTGYSWCASPIRGANLTKPSRRQTKDFCDSLFEDVGHGSCKKERDHILELGVLPPGTHIPECDAFGDYVPLQYDPSSGYSWCSSRHGVPWTEKVRSIPEGYCQSLSEHEQRNCAREILDIEKHGWMIGSNRPECDEFADYLPFQRSPSSGYGWCSAKNGTKIIPPEPSRELREEDCAPVAPSQLISAEGKGPCAKEVKRIYDANGGKPPRGKFIPNCDSKGDYLPYQFDPANGLSFCTTKEGDRITKPSNEITKETCEKLVEEDEEEEE